MFDVVSLSHSHVREILDARSLQELIDVLQALTVVRTSCWRNAEG